MNKKLFATVCGVALAAFVLDSCDTPTGQGAAAGAGAGGLIGGVGGGGARRAVGGGGGGGPRGAVIGAAIGAASGALIGHAIQEDRAREYGPPPPGGYPFGRRTDRPGIFLSPYTGRSYDLRGVPPGGLTRDVDTNQLFRRP